MEPPPLSTYRRRVLSRYVQSFDPRLDHENEDVMTEQAGSVSSGIKGTAEHVGWLKIIFGVGVVLIVAGGGAALYAASFATHDEVQGTMVEHQATDGHPTTTKALRDMADRLIRVEIVQQAMATSQQSMATTQEKMDDKLDQLLRSPATWRVPLPAAPP